jgi:hypothetical protein
MFPDKWLFLWKSGWNVVSYFAIFLKPKSKKAIKLDSDTIIALKHRKATAIL